MLCDSCPAVQEKGEQGAYESDRANQLRLTGRPHARRGRQAGGRGEGRAGACSRNIGQRGRYFQYEREPVGGSIRGGIDNTATGYYSSVGGGYGNTASGYNSSVGGGYENTASGGYSSVGGGRDQIADDFYEFLPQPQ